MKYLAALLMFITPLVIANDSGVWFDPDQDGHGISLHEWGDSRVFWWYGYHPVFGQVWFMSSVEAGDDFVLFRPSASGFPTDSSFSINEPVGTATLVKSNDRLLFLWDLLEEEQTCSSLYGFVPFGPIDPRCLDADDKFVPDRVLREGIDEQGTARFIRLTPDD